MGKAAKRSMRDIPNNIDSALVKGIKIPFGIFHLRKWPIIWRTCVVCGLILLPIDLARLGEKLFTLPGVVAWIMHVSFLSPIIAGAILYGFKYEVNEFGVKCFNLKGGSWFVQWENFAEVKRKKFAGVRYISVSPSDNYDKFAISELMEHYDLFKALVYRINKGEHKLIEHL